MAKAKRKTKGPRTDYAKPTPEQLAKGEYSRLTLAYRRESVIDTLLRTQRLSQRQYNALRRYRDIAVAEDHSYRRDSLDMAQHASGGPGLGLPPGMAHMRLGKDWQYELSWLESELGSLQPIARAIAVDDNSLSQWAMDRSGSVERRRTLKDRIVTLFEPHRKAYKDALMDIRMAGERLAAAIGA